MVKKTWSKDDKVSLIDFVDAIDTRHKLIKYDECYNWRIQGTSGHVYAIPEHGVFYICVETGSPRAWGAAKKFMAFCTISQDGDDEGVFRLNRLPTTLEGNMIRRVVGLPKRRRISPETKERLARYSFKNREPRAEAGDQDTGSDLT